MYIILIRHQNTCHDIYYDYIYTHIDTTYTYYILLHTSKYVNLHMPLAYTHIATITSMRIQGRLKMMLG